MLILSMNIQLEKVRVDKWLWAVRIFKTRSQAAEACARGKIFIDGVAVKASRLIKTNEILSIRRGSFTLMFQVIQPIENRVSAAIKDQFCKDMTSADEYEKIKMHSLAVRTYRQHNEGRPTKKERRALDDFLDW